MITNILLIFVAIFPGSDSPVNMTAKAQHRMFNAMKKNWRVLAKDLQKCLA